MANVTLQRVERLAPTLATLTFARLILNGMRRFPYLVLTPLAATLGVPRATLETVLSLTWVLSLISPLASPFIERGRKRVMLVGLGLFVIGAGLAAVGQTFGFVALALAFGSLSKTLYDPSMLAYVGDHVPFARRGMAIGVTELAWSGSLVTFGPLSAFLITRVGPGAIFGLLAICAAVAWLVLLRVLPNDTAQRTLEGSDRPAAGVAIRSILQSHPALVLLLAIFLIALAFDLFLIIYESWLIENFKLDTLTIGNLSFVFGAAELGGEAVIIFLSDRVGKKRLAVAAALATAVTYVVLGLTSATFALAMLTLFLMFFCFEISTISVSPLATEIAPAARGYMLTFIWSSVALGRALGTFGGGVLFRAAGFGANMGVAAVLSAVAGVLLWAFFRLRD